MAAIPANPLHSEPCTPLKWVTKTNANLRASAIWLGVEIVEHG